MSSLLVRVAVSAAAALALAGCSVTRHGTLARIPGGPLMIVTVTIEDETATVEGSHPDSGEALRGRLEVVNRERGADGAPAIPTDAAGGSASPMGIPPGQPSAASPQVLEFAGTITGDQGTELVCELEVEKRVRIRGNGICREAGATADAPYYRLQF